MQDSKKGSKSKSTKAGNIIRIDQEQLTQQLEKVANDELKQAFIG